MCRRLRVHEVLGALSHSNPPRRSLMARIRLCFGSRTKMHPLKIYLAILRMNLTLLSIITPSTSESRHQAENVIVKWTSSISFGRTFWSGISMLACTRNSDRLRAMMLLSEVLWSVYATSLHSTTNQCLVQRSFPTI